MRNTFYLPNTYNGFHIWLNNFAAKFETYSAYLGYGAEEVNSVKRDAFAFGRMQNIVVSISAYKMQTVKWRNILLDGKAGAELSALPEPQLMDPPADFSKGIKPRIRKLVQHIKSNKGYAAHIGKDLGIIGGEKQLPLSEIKPSLKLVLKGGVVVVQWKKGIADAIRIEVMRGGNQWELLGIDMEPHFIDSAHITQPAIWQYRAMYLINDKLQGQWSDAVSITVG